MVLVNVDTDTGARGLLHVARNDLVAEVKARLMSECFPSLQGQLIKLTCNGREMQDDQSVGDFGLRNPVTARFFLSVPQQQPYAKINYARLAQALIEDGLKRDAAHFFRPGDEWTGQWTDGDAYMRFPPVDVNNRWSAVPPSESRELAASPRIRPPPSDDGSHASQLHSAQDRSLTREVPERIAQKHLERAARRQLTDDAARQRSQDERERLFRRARQKSLGAEDTDAFAADAATASASASQGMPSRGPPPANGAAQYGSNGAGKLPPRRPPPPASRDKAGQNGSASVAGRFRARARGESHDFHAGGGATTNGANGAARDHEPSAPPAPDAHAQLPHTPAPAPLPGRAFFSAYSCRVNGCDFALLHKSEGKWTGVASFTTGDMNPHPSGAHACSSKVGFLAQRGCWVEHQQLTGGSGVSSYSRFWYSPQASGVARVDTDLPELSRASYMTLREVDPHVLVITAADAATGALLLTETVSFSADFMARVRTGQRFDAEGRLQGSYIARERKFIDEDTGALERVDASFD